MSFDPPQLPGYDEEYSYGNIKWKFDGTAGVWNIVDGSLVGAQGPKGDKGDPGEDGADGLPGPTGNTGTTGEPSLGDGAAIIVSGGVVTARVPSGFGETGVLGVTGRFALNNGIVSLLPASNGESGIASFNSAHFTVSGTGHVSINGDIDLGGGDTVVAGNAIDITLVGEDKRITNIGVTSFNGLTGAVTLTGDGGAIIGRGNNTITARLADTSVTGVARFSQDFFDVTNGLVGIKNKAITNTQLNDPSFAINTGSGLAGGGSMSLGDTITLLNTGVTGIGFGNDAGLTGKINITNGSNITITQSNKLITISASVGGGNGASITAGAQQVLFASGNNGATGSNNFLFDGSSATFGGNSTSFTVTGPNFAFGVPTKIKDGIHLNPAEFSPWNGANSVIGSALEVRGSSGTVQRYQAGASNFTVSASNAAGAWSNQEGVAETIIVLIQSTSGRTGQFADSVLVQRDISQNKPVLCGVTGAIDVFSIMRIKTSNGGVTMGFVVASGLTASGTNLAI